MTKIDLDTMELPLSKSSLKAMYTTSKFK